MKLQEYFFVRKENKNNEFIQQFFSSVSPSSATFEITMTHEYSHYFVFFEHKVFS